MGMNISKETLEIVLEALDDNAYICDADGDEMNNDQVLRAASLLREEMDANEIERLRLRWIPVSERLPEDGQSVAVCFEGGGMTGQVGEATFNKRGGWFSTERGAWGATHWMPLPEPPEAKPMLTAEDRESIESAVRLTLKKMNFLGGATPETK